MAGKLVHFEIPAKDSARARKFYGALLGWKFKDSGMPGIEYYLVDGADPGGALYPNAEKKAIGVYFDTDDIDASIRKLRDLGGRAEDKGPIPGEGWFANCVDTEGNEFGLFQSDHSVKMPERPTTASANR